MSEYGKSKSDSSKKDDKDTSKDTGYDGLKDTSAQSAKDTELEVQLLLADTNLTTYMTSMTELLKEFYKEGHVKPSAIESVTSMEVLETLPDLIFDIKKHYGKDNVTSDIFKRLKSMEKSYGKWLKDVATRIWNLDMGKKHVPEMTYDFIEGWGGNEWDFSSTLGDITVRWLNSTGVFNEPIRRDLEAFLKEYYMEKTSW